MLVKFLFTLCFESSGLDVFDEDAFTCLYLFDAVLIATQDTRCVGALALLCVALWGVPCETRQPKHEGYDILDSFHDVVSFVFVVHRRYRGVA